MKQKTEMSLKTKKILAGVGIAFGTVLVFLISFTLSFSLIVNPINLFTFKDGDTIKENAELKEQVQTLNDEIDVLTTTVDKYKANQSVPAIVETPVTSDEQNQEPEKQNSEVSAPVTATDENPPADTQDEPGSFSPETVTGTDAGTPEDVEEPITVIDISE
ncbi:MAG: hypothetical protein IJE62_06605 [Clostridia bacterium]|nr:hypothetical protein [Clostridia bacterium]